MTREEALSKVKGYLTDLLPSEEYDEVEEIIKALEQEPCEDLVSRLTAKEALNRIGESISDCINAIPPVTPTRKKGKWIKTCHGFPPEPYTTCSNCDYDIDFEISKLVKADAFAIEPYRPNYCPNCGAEMEIEEEMESEE